MAMMARPVGGKGLRIWLPAIRAGSGADVFTIRMADALRRAGHEPLLQWFDHRYELLPQLLKKVRAPPSIDIVHAGSWQAFAFKRANIPLVVTEHHYVLDPAFRPFKSWAQHLYHRAMINGYMQRSFAAADAVVSDSNFTAHVLSDSIGLSVAQIIPLWADYDLFLPKKEESSSQVTGGKFRLFFAGNASVRKGIDVIPSLAKRLGGNFEIRCTAGLRANGEVEDQSNIVLLGRLSPEDLISEYQHCDAVLVPSRYEGFGYAALEAMACGKPVVGFRCGAVDEVVVDGETGLLCDVDDLDTLAAHCRQLASNQSLLRRFGAVGRERAIKCFSEKAGVEAYLNLYNSLSLMSVASTHSRSTTR
jgi:glycosyltransferase involved in cell wall biosynthesis